MSDPDELSQQEASTTGTKERLIDKDQLWTLLPIVVVAAVALLVAYLCFGILSSQANTKVQSYSLGGAIAGFIVSFTVLFSSYSHIRKSTNAIEKIQQQHSAEMEKIQQRHSTDMEKFQQTYKKDTETLRKQNEELQQKIIRGAPHPLGYDTEVDERQKIVLARPSNWLPKGGVVFNFQLSDDELEENDQFPATCVITGVPAGRMSQSDFYNDVIREVQISPDVESHTAEYIYVGGEPKAIKCLKIIANRFVEVRVTRDRIKKKTDRAWNFMSHDAFKTEIDKILAEEADKPLAAAAAVGSSSPIVPAAPPAISTAPPQASVPNPSQTTAHADSPAASQSADAPAAHEPKADPAIMEEETEERMRYLVKINHMTVFCYHEELSKIFYFDFYDDRDDFPRSSEAFNRILESTRFLSN